MKTARIITIVCWLITALILIGLCIWLISGNLFGIKSGLRFGNPFANISIDNLTGPYNVVGTYTVPAGDIDSIDLSWVAGEITITPYDGTEIKLTEYARRDLKDNEKLVYKTSGGTLEVKYVEPSMTINMLTKKLEMLVPQALASKLNKLKVDATSAELYISGFEAQSFDIQETSGESDISDIKAAAASIRSVSGTIRIAGLSANELTLASTSGEILISDVTADTVKSESTSGEQIFSGTFKDVNIRSKSGTIKLNDVTADTVQTNTVSGEHALSGTFKEIDASSISGEIDIASSINPTKISCGTTSGGITVTIPGNGDLTVSYSTVSGDFKSEVPVRTGGSADYRFTSVSGDINIKAA